MKKIVLILLYIVNIALMDNGWCQSPVKEYPNSKIFKSIRNFWHRGDYRGVQKLLAKRVAVHLGNFRGSFPRQQVVGMLKAYFGQIQVEKFAYEREKMSIDKGVADYHFRHRKTGVLHQKRLYFYLRKKGDVWVITSISEI